MSDDLNVLRELGAQKIHKETHISKEHIQEILHESFDGLNSVQFVGFISILEREYNIDLSDLKAKGMAHFEEVKPVFSESKKVFVVPKRQKNYTTLYILLAIIIFVSFIYYKFGYLDSNTNDIETVDNTKIEKAQKSLGPVLQIKKSSVATDSNETNGSVEATVIPEIKSDVNAEKEIEAEKKADARSLKLLPKNKVWLGYIDIKTNQRHQKIFTEDFEIDATKDWLLLFGAGNIKLEVNGEIKKFASKQNMRFKYVNGELIEISLEEFKELNKGRRW